MVLGSAPHFPRKIGGGKECLVNLSCTSIWASLCLNGWGATPTDWRACVLSASSSKKSGVLDTTPMRMHMTVSIQPRGSTNHAPHQFWIERRRQWFLAIGLLIPNELPALAFLVHAQLDY